MDEPTRFRPGRLVARGDAGGGLTRVTVEPEAEQLATYVRPGQYIEMLAGGETGFFVLSSDPGARPWELVMRSGGGASDVVLAADVGTPLGLTAAIGDGFPVEAARGAPLALALGGTGVAAGPPVVRQRVRDGDAARTLAVVGVRGGIEVPVAPELTAWQHAGVTVVVCWTDGAAPAAPDGVIAEPGFVHDAVERRLASGTFGPPAHGRMFAVGPATMIDALRGVASRLSMDVERVHTNY